MRGALAVGAIFFAAISGVSAKSSAQLCQGSAYDDGGNWYCKAVKKVQYTGINKPGSFQEVYGVNGGQCLFRTKEYSGAGAPLAEQLSIHFRGPLIINQTAVYIPKAPSKAKRTFHHHHHGHQRFHKRRQEHKNIEERDAEAEKRQVGKWITATIDNQVVSWQNNWDGSRVVDPTPVPAPNSVPDAAAPPIVSAAGNAPAHVSTPATGASAPTATRTSSPSTPVQLNEGDWARTGYYQKGAKPVGLSFLNNAGQYPKDTDPDAFLGARLGEVDWDGTLESAEEVMMYTDKDCDESCGFVRAGGVNKSGFEGARKLFAFQFSMPDDHKGGFLGSNPAIWSLNARIARTQQYGACSCWGSGCGEFDLWETLSAGDKRCKSTYHAQIGGGGGDSNFFDRPMDPQKPITGVALFYDDTVTVAYVDDFNFNEKLTADTIKKIMTMDPNSDSESHFAVAG